MAAAADWRGRLRRAAPERHVFRDDGLVPNSPLPVLLYRGALRLADAADPAAPLEAAFAAHDWRGAWRDGIYDFRHYHSLTHEVLGVARGQGQVEIGGAAGSVLGLAPGDVVVLPAGVGHRAVRLDADFLVVGAYPGGREWDLLRDRPEDRATALRNIAGVPLPETDPLYGAAGPLRDAWSG